MFDKLKSVEKRYNDLNQLLSDPKIISQQSEFQKYAREQSELAPIVNRFQNLQKINRQLEESKTILGEEKDQELIEMAQEDMADLETKKSAGALSFWSRRKPKKVEKSPLYLLP